MARSRNIKPGFFTNDELAELPALTRLLFIGLWTLVDRDGRIEDRPKKIKAECMPYDDMDADAALSALCKSGFILRYEADGTRCIQVQNWHKHQNPHVKELASTLPAPDKHQTSPVQEPDKAQPQPERAGLIPDSGFLIPDSSISVPVGTGAAAPPPSDRDVVFANGVVLLTAAGVKESNARSFLASQCKEHGEAAVRAALERCASEAPIQPIPWLQAALKSKPARAGPGSKSDALMARNLAVLQRFAEPTQ